MTALPSRTDGQRLLALTLDDGTDANVIAAYTQLARDTGIRLTYFVNGVNTGWTQNAPMLRPLVDSGQIQLGNHTWSHPNLTTLTAEQIADQMTRNTKFLVNTYGVDPAPYFRPPYGKHNAATDSVTQGLGYGPPVLWYGSLSDSGVVTPEYIVDMARKYFNPQQLSSGTSTTRPSRRSITSCSMSSAKDSCVRSRSTTCISTRSDVVPAPAVAWGAYRRPAR